MVVLLSNSELESNVFANCCIGPQHESYILQREQRPSILLRRDSCHFHKLISPRNEIIVGKQRTALSVQFHDNESNCCLIAIYNVWCFSAHCPGPSPVVEYTESFDTYKSHRNGKYL